MKCSGKGHEGRGPSGNEGGLGYEIEKLAWDTCRVLCFGEG